MAHDGPPDILASILKRYSNLPAHKHRPLVTLTFAQSLDAKIAGQHSKQLILSGNESMIMTHWMRTMHDAILIGIGTALNDDPQLNTRRLPPRPQGSAYLLPRPVIIDSRLRLPPTCKLLRNYQNGEGRRPWVISTTTDDTEWVGRLQALKKAGANVIQIPAVEEGSTISIHAILDVLRQHGIQTLMVEGGARIIASFLTAQSVLGKPIVDSVIITIAPTFVGAKGVGYGVETESDPISAFHHVGTEKVGKDTVVTMIARHV